jgi:thiosulfate reductase cytochrome b subunit
VTSVNATSKHAAAMRVGADTELWKGRRAHPFLIRLAHWLNVPLLVLMAGSGLQILVAYPSLGPRGEEYAWYPWQAVPPPTWLRFGRWLAGARHWHFALAWLLLANAAIYLTYVIVRGEWRRRAFGPRRDAANGLRMMAYYLRLRRTPPPVDFYNGLQRFAYTFVMVIALVEVLSGLAIYKPVQLWWIALLFGGYDGARAVHLIGLTLLGLFTVAHLVMVGLHPRSILDMLTGGRRA